MAVPFDEGPFAPFAKDVGDGWRDVLEQLSDALCDAFPQVTVRQVKEKFGVLRVYVDLPEGLPDGSRERAQQIISTFERRSAEICERCGDPGTLRSEKFWRKTACDSCA